MTKRIYSFTVSILSLFIAPVFVSAAIIGRFFKKKNLTKENINVIWGTTSLTNYKHWSNALVAAGWESKSVVGQVSIQSSFNDFNYVLFKKPTNEDPNQFNSPYQVIRNFLRFVVFFLSILLKTNLVVHSCEGLVFHHYNKGFFSYKIEYIFLKIANVKIIIIPYGSDAHVYRRIRNPYWLAGLLSDYPQNARIQNRIAKRVDFYVEKADLFLPGSAILDGFGRSDAISVNTLCIDTELWRPIPRAKNRHLVITHTPNHRGVKGTESIIKAISQLNEEGYELELILIEKKSNEEVRTTLQSLSDIHIDQLNSDAYALSAIEAMALGIPTISSFGGTIRDFFSEWSFAETCPILNSNSENLIEVLRELVSDSKKRVDVGKKSREYAVRYHSYEHFAKFFHELLVSEKIIKTIV